MAAGQKRPWPDSSNEGVSSGSDADAQPDSMTIFKPLALRSLALTAEASINKALFTRTFDLAAARVHDPRNISKYRQALASSNDLLEIARLHPVVDDPEPSAVPEGPASGGPVKPPPKKKCLLLQPHVSPTEPKSWSTVLKQGVERNELGVIPYQLTLDYEHWTPREVLVSILPEEFHDDIPTGFNTAGHVAHLNLRERFKPYKYIVGQVILDKNAALRTVINKTDDVGTESAFRTFRYEVLAGPDDMAVEVRENCCTYHFDYSKVYWNSKLEREHTRLLNTFRPGQVVADVMAGIGPFAVPAGRRGVFVWANDMNPDSYAALCESVARNKVAPYVRPFNEDGMLFIHRVADLVREAAATYEGARAVPSVARNGGGGNGRPSPSKDKKRVSSSAADTARPWVPVPPTIDHFVMNLPASAITFLPRFRGLYAGCEGLFKAKDEAKVEAKDDSSDKKAPPKLPLIHVHCFDGKPDEDESVPKRSVCERVSAELGVPMTLCPRLADAVEDDPLAAAPKHLVYVHNVRNVAPNKTMYCASFRLPAAVAFAARPAEDDRPRPSETEDAET